MARSETIDEKGDTKINEEIVVDAGRPKSKKELRLERKAKRKSIEASSATELEEKSNCDCYGMLGKEEYVRLKRLRRAKERKEQEKLTRKKLLEEKKLRKRKKLNRELNAKGGAKNKYQKVDTDPVSGEASGGNKQSSKSKKSDAAKDEQDASMNAFRSVLYGTNVDSELVGGMTTTRLGVQYKDKVVGKGRVIREGRPITVRYELTGGKFGAVLDSSPKFIFRPGMGEVIQGWDIGLEGMREGGRRKLIVPPKAGYGGKDIGAGPGALLYFDITLLSCGK